MITHPFKPIYDKNSKILILGSFPSVKSRENNFYYAHPQNRFWKILSDLYETDEPQSTEEKKDILLKNNIAIWDVLKSCEIEGSADSTIKNPIVNDIKGIVENSKVNKIFFNGKKSFEIYNKYNKNIEGVEYETLPSTSPANAVYSFDKIYNIWKNKLKGE